MKILDISGSWHYAPGEAKPSDTDWQSDFILPGSTCDNQVGIPREGFPAMTEEAVRAPRERFEYIGSLWLQREIDLPEDFAGQALQLFLERVNIASELWIDEKKIHRQVIGLSTPHIYRLDECLSPGRHLLTLRIDNRNLLNLDNMASGYSVDTQGYWCGILGRMELQAQPVFHIKDVQIYPLSCCIQVKIVINCEVYSPFGQSSCVTTLSVTTPDGQILPAVTADSVLYNSTEVEYMDYPIPDPICWNEFHPELYTLHVLCRSGEHTASYSVSFGMREIARRGNRLFLNNRPLALRGTIDCAIFPLTGYPSMNTGFWRKRMQTIKDHGLNHLRFHAWCPPEAAFTAADELGVYLSVEMPLWLNRDVCALEVGDDPIHRIYFTQEALSISKTYGNHPSFLMFSCGNENMGDMALLEDIIIQTKACDPRRFYTLTTNFDHNILPCEDYLCAYEASGKKVRIQDLHDEVAVATTVTYSEAVAATPVPVISFETGQYCVYPDVDLISQYNGNIRPVNLEVIRRSMQENGIYAKKDAYIKASGDLAVKLYKEDIEACMRTEGFGGYELLSLTDYTGQSTATIGLLDAFWHSKGLISPDEFASFSGPVVPLFLAKRIFSNEESLEADLMLYDFGEQPLTNYKYKIRIYLNENVFYSCDTHASHISVPLDKITQASLLRVSVSVETYTNHWNVYVFPAAADAKDTAAMACELPFIHTQGELRQVIADGGIGILTPALFQKTIACSFVPVFWSPVHFPSKKPCGAIIRKQHPVFNDFPTGQYPDYQWKELLDHAKAVDISAFPKTFEPLVELVPNFFDNTPAAALWEVCVPVNGTDGSATGKKARLLYCGFDLNHSDPATRQLRTSITNYTNYSSKDPISNTASDAFMPSCELSPELLFHLLA